MSISEEIRIALHDNAEEGYKAFQSIFENIETKKGL